MAYDPVAVESHISDILNATSAGWGGVVTSRRRSTAAIQNARKQSTYDVIRAIASNPRHGRFGAFATLVPVNHNDFLPAHDGEPGIPWIVPFPGADAREGIPADPDEIDSYREDLSDSPIYSGALDGVAVAHNEQSHGRPSPVACRYSIVNKRLKFTGESAEVPLIVITEAMLTSDALEGYEGAIVRLSPSRLVKEGDNLYLYASGYTADGKQDLIEIAGGAMSVKPPAVLRSLPNVALAQKVAI